ncbi:MAG: rRNA methyltransferase [Bacteroidetes bacterium]|jgi:23S rRNA (adenine1618-N6)-methyltransferase|nr:rRNA methyltransferase [Bacteroidota bacterium]
METERSKDLLSEKNNLHPRNKHRSRYDFRELIAACKQLAPFVFTNKYKVESIDFSKSEAVKMLNKALLKRFYNISYWDVPPGYLCPPIPGRADYIHYTADLLASCNDGVIPVGKDIRLLDIGVGANCVYPIIGHQEYGWNFVASDIDDIAVKNARKIVTSNPDLNNAIDCRFQSDESLFFKGIIKEDEVFDLTICNPPFHTSEKAAAEGTRRKNKNLGTRRDADTNFGGQSHELYYKGGETSFIYLMILQSAEIPKSCLWYTTLVSDKDNLPAIYKTLEKVDAIEVRTINMSQGQKKSRIVAWTFLNKDQQKEWAQKRFQVSNY